MNELLGWMESHLQGLSSYVPDWLEKIESRRRALMLGRGTVPPPPEQEIR